MSKPTGKVSDEFPGAALLLRLGRTAMTDPDTAESLLPLPDVPGRYVLVVEVYTDNRGDCLRYRWDREAEPISLLEEMMGPGVRPVRDADFDEPKP
jgi:hypothetical protein